MKNRAIVVGTLGLCALFAGCRGLTRPVRPTERGWRLPPVVRKLGPVAGDVAFFADSGQIRVETAETPEVEQVMTISAGSEDAARKIAAQCKLTTKPGKDGETVFYLETPDQPPTRCGADSRLRLPSGRSLTLRTSAGLIDTTGFAAENLRIESNSGRLRVGSAKQIEFVTKTGDIELLDAFETATGRSTSGNLTRVNAVPGGRLEVHSTSGDCTIYARSGTALDVRYRTKAGQLLCPAGDQFRTGTARDTEHPGWREHKLAVAGATKPFVVVFESAEGDLVLRLDTGQGG